MAGLLAFGLAGQALAEPLRDPTRPPAVLTAASDAAPAAPAGPVLQSVLIASGRRVAVISGQTVQVGQKLGEARVVKITEGEVALRTGKALRILKLFPGIDKQRTAVAYTTKVSSRR